MRNKLKTPRTRITTHPRTWWTRARTTTYTTAGFACITTAAYTTLPQLGWLTAGAALLALEYLGGKDDQSGGGIP